MKRINKFSILTVKMEGFKRFKEPYTMEFDRLTYISGANGQGKSTIADAIAYAFCGTPFWGEKGLDKLQNPECKEMSVEVQFVDENGEVHNLSRRRNGNTTTVIFDNGHILTVGYKYNQLHMSEHYNAPGSPYWALKAFAFMALPDEHEFWTAEAEKLPQLDGFKRIEKADMLLSRYNGNVTMYPAEKINNYNHGQTLAKYAKFAYSTLFGFSVSRGNNSLSESAPDSSLVFEIDGLIFQRLRDTLCTVNDESIVLKWSPFMGIEVTTTIIPKEYGHIRKHIVSSQYDCMAYDSGFAVSNMDTDKAIYTSEIKKASVVNAHSKCIVQSDCGEGMLINAVANTNLMFPKTLIPSIKYKIKKGTNEFTTYVYEV